MSALRAAVAVMLLCSLAAACARSGPAPGPGPAGPHAAPTTAAHGTLGAAPLRERPAARCRLIDEHAAAERIGLRLGRVRELTRGGRFAGCRIYAVQHSSFDASENLPGPRQPVIEIVTTPHPSATAAHNAFVRLAEAGTGAQRERIGDHLGLCFLSAFYAPDHGRDWSCAFTRGRTEVVVRTVVTSPALSVVRVARVVFANIPAAL